MLPSHHIVNICCVRLYLPIHNYSNQHNGMESIELVVLNMYYFVLLFFTMYLQRECSYFNLVVTDLEDVTWLVTVVVMPYVETCFAGRHVEMLSHTTLTLDTRTIKLVQATWNELMVDNQKDTFKLLYIPNYVIDLLCSVVVTPQRNLIYVLSEFYLTFSIGVLCSIPARLV
jgi:hypothetical protein